MGTDWNGDGKVDWQDTAWESFDDDKPSGGGGGGNSGGCVSNVLAVFAVPVSYYIVDSIVYSAAGYDMDDDSIFWADMLSLGIVVVILLVILGFILRDKK